MVKATAKEKVMRMYPEARCIDRGVQTGLDLAGLNWELQAGRYVVCLGTVGHACKLFGISGDTTVKAWANAWWSIRGSEDGGL